MFKKSKYPKAFEKAMVHVFKSEGGYVNHKHDRGRATNWGISQLSYPHLDIKKLSKTHAKEIYYRDYYQKVKAHKIKHEHVAFYLFDMAINHGTRTAVKILQKSVNVVSPNSRRLSIDGLIGSATIRAVNKADNLSLYHTMQDMRWAFYKSLMRRKPSQEVFRRGWKKRAYLDYA
jgi:lysozyme family protein